MVEILREARKNAKVARERNKAEFNARHGVSLDKFSKNDRVMVLFPSAGRKGAIRKFCWNHFGPFKIVEIGETSAEVVTSDKLNALPMKVPISRLIRVPEGIPDTVILPRGRAKFRELLSGMCVQSAGYNVGEQKQLEFSGDDHIQQ